MVNQIAHATPAEHLPPLPDHASALCPQPCSTETSALHGQHFLQLLQLLPPLTQSVLHGVRIVWQLHACELPPDLLPQLTVGFFGSLLDRFQERPVELDSLVAEYEVFQLRHATTEGQMVEHCSSGKAFLIML